jgi:hypothetical protein
MWRLVPLLFFLPLATPGAGDAALDRATLRGLKSLGVVVDRIDPELGKEGFDAETFQTRIEVRLRSAGLPVAANSNEFLGLRLLQVRGGRGPFAVCLSIGLYQPVVLARDPKMKTATQTWEADTVLLAEPKLVYRASLDSLDELVDHFIEAWRSVNPQ